MDKLLFKRILITILLVCMVSYVIYLFVGLNSNGSFEIENAVYTSVSDSIDTEGFIVRNEVLVSNNSSGVISYNVSDGDNVSVKQNIADIYNSEVDAVAQREIKNLENQISDLKKLSNSHFKESVGLDTVNSQIETEIFSILSDINSENYSLANNDGEDLLFYINERQIITGKVKNFNDKIAHLEEKKNKLTSTCSDKTGAVIANNAGYFIKNIDGYENAFDYDKVSEITLNDLSEAKKSEAAGNYIGKIVTDPEWYVVCKINKDDALALSKMQGKGQDVNILIPFITTQKIPAQIVSVNQKTRQDDGVLVLSCDYMNDEISQARIEDIKIETAFYDGLKVPKRAIYEDYIVTTVEENGEKIEKKEKVQGIYVLHGSELVFKQIVIDYSTKEYVICNPTPREDILLNGETVKLYDRIVIKGDNLYDGKIVE